MKKILFLSLIASIIVGCNKTQNTPKEPEKPKYEELEVTEGVLKVQTKKKATIEFKGTSANVALQVKDNSIINATINGNTLSIEGLKDGQTELTITDKQTKKSVTRPVVCASDFITFNTLKPEGETLKITIVTFEGKEGDIWFDLNNNGVKEANEVTEPANHALSSWTGGIDIVKQKSNTITIYGPTMGLKARKFDMDHIDLTHCQSINWLNLADNLLTTVDFSHSPDLSNLYLQRNKLTKIDLSQLSILTTLNIGDNEKLGSLSISANKNIVKAYCEKTGIKSIDTKGLSKLAVLEVCNNQLTELDLSTNPSLYEVYVHNNKISQANMDALISSLPKYNEKFPAKMYAYDKFGGQDGNGRPTASVCVKAKKGQNWKIVERTAEKKWLPITK